MSYRELRAQPRITCRFGPPIHPPWLRCSKLKYLDILHSSRLASRAPRLEDSFGTTGTRVVGAPLGQKKGTYSWLDPYGIHIRRGKLGVWPNVGTAPAPRIASLRRRERARALSKLYRLIRNS